MFSLSSALLDMEKQRQSAIAPIADRKRQPIRLDCTEAAVDGNEQSSAPVRRLSRSSIGEEASGKFRPQSHDMHWRLARP